MAQRRMFTLKIVDTDAFLDMPHSSQLLYFHLSMRADDDGFVANPKKITRMLGTQEDDYKLLVVKKFIIPFENGICVIKHWKMHNYIQVDRYTQTTYSEELAILSLDNNNGYRMNEECIQDVVQSVSTGKVRLELGKSKVSINNTSTVKAKKLLVSEQARGLINPIIELFKEVNPNYKTFYSNKTQRSSLERMLKEFGEEKLCATIRALPNYIYKPYAPKITSPLELEKNLGKLIAFVKSEDNSNNNKSKTAII